MADPDKVRQLAKLARAASKAEQAARDALRKADAALNREQEAHPPQREADRNTPRSILRARARVVDAEKMLATRRKATAAAVRALDAARNEK